MVRNVLITTAILGWTLGASAAQSTVDPDLAATIGGMKWQLDVAFHDPQRITLTLPGENEPKVYWYVLYTVTNNTGRDVQFFPSVSLVTHALEVVQAGDNVHPAAYDNIRARHEKEYPFVAPPSKVTGLLLQGNANARTTAAVFSGFEQASNEFTVYLSGASGEVQRVANPSYDPAKGESADNPAFFVMRRTLAVTYRVPGDEQTRRLSTPVRLRREWVMR